MSAPSQRTPRLPPQERRVQLLDAALDLIADEGFAAVSVEAVARRAGVTRPVVYDAFGDLDGLMLALIDREEEAALGPLLAIVGGDPGDDVDPEDFLVDSVLAFLRAVRENPRTWRFVLMPPRGSTRQMRERIVRTRRLIADRVTALLEWGVARRGGPLGLDLELFARLIVSAGEDAARLTLLHPRRYPPERIADLVRGALRLLPADAQPTGAPPPPALSDLTGPPPAVAATGSGPPSPERMPRAARREQLLDVTLDLLAAEGFEALTMEAVARRAQVNRTVVYRSFASQQVLLLALLRREDVRTRTGLDALLPTDPAGRTAAVLVAEALGAFLTLVARNPQTYRMVLQRPETAPLVLQKMVNRRRAALAQRLRPLVGWGLAGLAVDGEAIDDDVLARLLLSVAEELARMTLDDPDFPPARVASGTWALLDRVPLG